MMEVREMKLAAQHLRGHAAMGRERVEPGVEAQLDAVPLRQLEEVGRLLGDHRLQGAHEPRIGDAVEITEVVEHLRGWYAKPTGDIVQPDGGPAAPFLRDRNRRVHDARRQILRAGCLGFSGRPRHCACCGGRRCQAEAASAFDCPAFGGQLNTDRAGAPISFSTPSCAPWLPIINRPVDYPGPRDIVNHMVELHTPPLDPVFHALGDATRRRMLCELAQGERTVGQLAAPFAISLQAASKHIKVLEQAGLLRREVRGRTHLCWLEPGPLASAHEWLSFYERFWTERLDVLERLLRQEDARKSSRKRR